MTIERLANYASLIPYLQQGVGACTVVYGIGMLILHAARTEPEADQKARNIKNDLSTIAKGVLRAIPIIGTLFSLVLLIKDKLHIRSAIYFLPFRLHIHIHQKLLSQDPLAVLDFLGDYLDKNNSLQLDLKIKFIGEAGCDAGGLSRTFLCSLLQNSVALLCPNQELPSVKTAKDAQRMRTLGCLMYLAATKGNPIGANFSKNLFEALAISQQIISLDPDLQLIGINALMPIHTDSTKEKMLFLSAIPVEELSNAQLEDLAIILSAEDDLPQWWNESELTEKNIPNGQTLRLNALALRNQVAKIYTEDEVSLTENDNFLNPDVVKAFLLQKIKEKGQAQAILEIAKRLYPANGKYRYGSNQLKDLKAEDLQASIEGSDLTADKIKKSLHCSNKKLKNWIERWLEANKNNKLMLENLVYALTGSVNFKESKYMDDDNKERFHSELFFDNYQHEGTFSFATCGKSCSVNKRILKEYVIEKFYNNAKNEDNPHYLILEKAKEEYSTEEHSHLSPEEKEERIYQAFKKEIKENKIIQDEDLYEMFKENLENDIKDRKNTFNKF